MAVGTLYSVEDVATMLGLHVRTVRNYVRDGRLPAVRIGKQYRIAHDDIDKLTGGRVGTASSRPAASSTRVEVSVIVQVDGIDEPTLARLTALVTGRGVEPAQRRRTTARRDRVRRAASLREGRGDRGRRRHCDAPQPDRYVRGSGSVTSIYRSEEARRAVEGGYRAFLEAWPASSTETKVATRHGDTFVVACGPDHGPPVVLVHGAGFNSAAWTGDVEVWAQTHRVYAVDLIGEPGLSAPARPALSSDSYAEWLDDVLDGLGVTQAAFVGASLGGWMALDLALRRPERVARLALLAPGGIGRQKYAALVASLVFLPFGRRGRRAAVRFVLGPRAAPTPDDMKATSRALDDYLLLIQKSYRPRRDRLPIFTDDQLRKLDGPLLVIAGAKDRMLDSHDTARRLQHLHPEAVVTLLPDTGHIPTGYADTIQRFLTAEGPE